MRRWLLFGLLSCWVLLGLGAVEKTGSLRVTLRQGEQAVSGGTATLHQVGEPAAGGYRLTEEFGGGLIKEEDAGSGLLAQWLWEQVQGQGVVLPLDDEGTAEFTELAPGLYLLAQTQTDQIGEPMEAMLVGMPQGGQWNCQLMAQAQQAWDPPPKTGQHPAPIVAAMALVLSGLGLVMLIDGRNKRM